MDSEVSVRKLVSRIASARAFVGEERRHYYRAISRLLGVKYPLA